MFEVFRRKATNAALDAVRPLMATLRIRGTVPSAALHDPYFLGFITIVSTFHALLVTKGNTSKIGFVLQDVLKEIGGDQHLTMVTALTEYANGRHPDYMRGQRDGDTVCSLTYGLQKTNTGSLATIAPDPAAALSLTQTFLQYLNSKYRS